MDRQETKPMVLARIPDLGTTGPSRSAGPELASSSGRMLSQALSFKLLAGVTLLLVAMAIVPYAVRSNAPTAAPLGDSEALPAWCPGPPAASADAAPVWTAPVAKSLAPAPVGPSPMAGVLPQPTATSDIPAPASADAPLMSGWPRNPTHPTSSQTAAGVEEPQTGANRAMAIRPTEQIGNNYDRIRPSVH